jgi:hypothetical protein
MNKFVSSDESIVNLEKVSNIILDGLSIKFFRLPISADEQDDTLEIWFFKDEEAALVAWENLKDQLGIINL